MDRINLNEYDLLPFDLEKCSNGHLTVARDGRVFKFGAFTTDDDVRPEERLTGWIDGYASSRDCDGETYGFLGIPEGNLRLAVKKSVEKPKRTKGVNTYQINVRRGLEIIVNVEVDE